MKILYKLAVLAVAPVVVIGSALVSGCAGAIVGAVHVSRVVYSELVND